ncbi:methyltransferase [Paenibacillus albidus]|uniref:Methyltransferase n=1 Tax=Paenibacillus albidus TaxID=2041023 RepID=A0A917CAW9_9BACL|nr:class I SAM-dependent methyltransferase [Paenibacillus albidus]GGF82451.1 methyltransferase [Paenibacillus albidus]
MKQNIYDHPLFFEQYAALRNTGITYNDFIEQPAMKSALPVLEGLRILDLGCGTGQFATYCIENGASSVTGVDISSNMIEQANRENKHERIEYINMPIEDLELPPGQFDLIVSSLAVHYIENYDGFVEKASGLLRQEGSFILSTEHPIVTARREMNNWIHDEAGNRLHWALDDYQEEGIREQHWYIDGVIKYHRTLSTLINTLIAHGLVLEKVIEPQSIPAGLELMPGLSNERRKPSFILLKSGKK